MGGCWRRGCCSKKEERIRARMSSGREEEYMDMDKHKAERHAGERKQGENIQMSPKL